MATLISTTLAPDNGAQVQSAWKLLQPGQSVDYAVAYVAGDTGSFRFQYSENPTSVWTTVAEANNMTSGSDDFSGTYKNKTNKRQYVRFTGRETNGSSTDEQSTVTLTSAADDVQEGDVRDRAGNVHVDQFDEYRRFYTKLYVGYDGSSNDAFPSTADNESMARLIYNLIHTGAYGFYTRSYIGTAAISADAARIYGTVNDVAAATVRGLHCSLSMGTSGTVTGLGVAAEFTLHIPSTSGQTGTIGVAKFAINSDAATSDPTGATTLAYAMFVNQGNATGGADVDDDAVLFHIDGHTIADDNMVDTAGTEYALAEITHGIKIKVGSTLLWLLASSTNPKST